MDAKYCVIGEFAFNRTWVATKEDAIGHAKELLRNKRGAPAGTHVFVVKALVEVSIAEPNPPIEVHHLED